MFYFLQCLFNRVFGLSGPWPFSLISAPPPPPPPPPPPQSPDPGSHRILIFLNGIDEYEYESHLFLTSRIFFVSVTDFKESGYYLKYKNESHWLQSLRNAFRYSFALNIYSAVFESISNS